MGREITNENRYIPENAPITNVTELAAHLDRQLQRIAALLDTLAEGQIERSYVVPEKLKDGMIRYADGASWNPGAGRGIYFYDSTSTAWKLLG